MPPTPVRKTRGRVLGLLAILSWLALAWTYWRAQAVLPRQTIPLDLPNYSFLTVPVGSPFAVLNPTKDKLAFLDPATGRQEVVLEGDLKGAYSVFAAGSRKTFATLQTDGTAMVWHKPNGGGPAAFALPAFVYLACSPDGKLVGGHGPKENHVRLWDVPLQKEIATLDGHFDGESNAFLPDSRTLATVTGQGVKLWDVTTLQSRLGVGGHVRFFALTPDGRSLATCAVDDRVTVWDCATGQERASYRAPDYAQMMFFSPDGSKLAFSVSAPNSAWYDGLGSWFGASGDFKLMSFKEEATVLDAATGQHHGRVPCFGSKVAFADDHTLATLSKAEDAIQLWDLPPRSAIPSFVTWACLGVAVGFTAAWWSARHAGQKA